MAQYRYTGTTPEGFNDSTAETMKEQDVKYNNGKFRDEECDNEAAETMNEDKFKDEESGMSIASGGQTGPLQPCGAPSQTGMRL